MSITFLTGTINFSPLLFKVFQIKNNQKKKKKSNSFSYT